MWEDIKYAPKDGTKLYLCRMADGEEEDQQGPMTWDGEKWVCKYDLFPWYMERKNSPTHYMIWNGAETLMQINETKEIK